MTLTGADTPLLPGQKRFQRATTPHGCALRNVQNVYEDVRLIQEGGIEMMGFGDVHRSGGSVVETAGIGTESPGYV
ncbi:MAG: hypothetical protein HQL50_13955 [Magnetococcales bacterium]|nr:hypothetical protein [Magnetococcales bacterium]